MKDYLFLVATLTVFINQPAWSELQIPTLNTYESGRFLCQSKYASFVQAENGFYTSVPIDYKNPSLGVTDVYAYFYGGFDKEKKTILYFTGGPGLTSHWGLFGDDDSYNRLIIENRGIGCSRPNLITQYLSPAFYSSEAVARDAKLVIEQAGLKKVSAYGVSYGTVTATMFASLYPELTQALILEGTVYSGSHELFEATHRRKLVQKMIDQLPSDIQKKMGRVSSEFGVPNTWLSRVARNMLMSDNGLNELKNQLLSFSDEKSYAERIESYKDLYVDSTIELNPLYASNDIPYFMISCQELSLAKSDTSTEDALVNGKLIPTENTAKVNCEQLGAVLDQTYEANKYPVKVPVTYFQGSDDSATPAPGAFKHYKNVPQGFKQLLILVKGGHNPNLARFNSLEVGQKDLFKAAFEGTKVSSELLKKVRAEQDLKWVYTSSDK